MPSSPYQSRLLSFLNRQSLRWRDRLGKTSRQLRVAAEWGVQMLVYPVYLLVQTGRLFGNKIEQSAVNPQLTSSETDLDQEIPSDQPIEEILTLVEPWVIKEEQTLSAAATPTVEQLSSQIQQRVETIIATRQESNLLSQVTNQIQKAIAGNPPKTLEIQGVATLLDPQKLVLVADNNQTFNILTDEQQALLDKQIRTELGNYYYERRLYRLVGRHFPSLIPQFTEKDQNVLPPIRWFWRTMRWVQTSDVATSLNLFGESELIHPPLNPERKKILDNPDFPQGEWGKRTEKFLNAPKYPDLSQLRQLTHSAVDSFYQGLQNSPLIKSQLVQQLPETSAIIQTKLVETAKISQQKLLKPATAQLEQLKQQIFSTPDDPFRLRVLIRVAITHFFTDSSITLHPSRHSKLDSSPQDPWLTTEDIFPIPQSLETPQTALVTKTSSQTPPTLEDVVTPQPLPTQSAATAIASPPIPQEEESVVTHSLEKSQSSPQSVDYTPDWIETEVQEIGYVQHPLEKLLKGLDQVILWIEERLVKIIKKLLKLWQHFTN